MVARIFIDGAAGTTGLEIRERLAGRSELELVRLSDAERKDAGARKAALNAADLVILCLPDDAAREAVTMIVTPKVRVIDASTAHRVAPGWVFGFPELETDGYERLAAATRVTNPGCYSTGFLAAVRPLVRAGTIPDDYPYSVNAVSGYSGGGKSMIAEFEDKDAPDYTRTVVRSYALTLAHKHIPEMTERGGLKHPPVFSPSVGRYYRGMLVDVPLQLWAMKGEPKPAEFHAAPDDGMWVDSKAMLEALRQKRVIIDARPEERFSGFIEPLDKVAGHIPGSVNAPFEDNLDMRGNFLKAEDLRAQYESLLRGAPPREVIHMCGSGVTACHNLLALEIAGLSGGKLYVGSWSEWITDPSRPIVKRTERKTS